MQPHSRSCGSFFLLFGAFDERFLSCRPGLLQLPEEVLALILEKLAHLPALMAARLACRRLREVSYSIMTSLNINADAPDTRLGPLLGKLNALTLVTKVCLHGNVVYRTDLLQLNPLMSVLRELDLRQSSCSPTAIQAFCVGASHVTNITSLKWQQGNGGEALVPILTSYTNLVSLELMLSISPSRAPAFRDAVTQLSDLCRLSIRWSLEEV